MWQLHKIPHPWERILPSKGLHLPFLLEGWSLELCRKSNKAKDAHKKHRSQTQHPHGGRKRADEVAVLEGDPAFDEVMIQALLADQKRPEDLKQITLTDISIDVMPEAFATVDMPVASNKRASL